MSAVTEKETVACLEATLYKRKPFNVDKTEANTGKVKAWGLGVLRNYFFYQFCLNKLLRKNSPRPLSIYLMICFFRLDTSSTNTAKLVNAMVEQSKVMGLPASVVNAVLRQYMLNQEKFRIKARGVESIQYNMRPELLGRLKSHHQCWREIVRFMQEPSAVCLAVCQHNVSVEDMIFQLQEAEVAFSQEGPAIVLERFGHIRQLPGYEKGWFTVLSEANQQIEALLPDARPQAILDACAAPGGKSVMLRSRYGFRPRVVAADNDSLRLTRLQENNARLGLKLEIVEADSAVYDYQEPFDLIWADVPCSATGVIAKHPEIAIQERDDLQNQMQQRQMLENLWAQLSSGGHLVYSTCSVLPEENEQQVAWLLSQQQDASVVTMPQQGWIKGQHGCYLTSEHSRDVVYIAVLAKH